MLSQNSKLKKTSKLHSCKILGFNLPPRITCPQAGECKKYCYAVRCMARCKKQLNDNFMQSKHPNFVVNMAREIEEKKPTHVRIHPSGDFYNKAYFIQWIKIARLFPDVIFYAYTKSVSIIGPFILPNNMFIMYSYGGNEDDLILPADKHCIVVEEAIDIPDGYACGNDDDLQMLFHDKIAFIKH